MALYSVWGRTGGLGSDETRVGHVGRAGSDGESYWRGERGWTRGERGRTGGRMDSDWMGNGVRLGRIRVRLGRIRVRLGGDGVGLEGNRVGQGLDAEVFMKSDILIYA